MSTSEGATPVFLPKEKPSTKEILSAVPFVFRLIYDADRKGFVLYFLTNVFEAPLAGLSVIAITSLSDGLIAQHTQQATTWAFVLILTSLFSSAISSLREYVSDKQRVRLELSLSQKSLEHLTQIPFPILEDSGFQALSSAFYKKFYVILNLNQWLHWMTFQGFSILGYATVFALLPWTATIVILLAIALRWFTSWHEVGWQWSLFQKESREGRRAQYYQNILSSPFSLLATKGLGLHKPFFERWKVFSLGLLKERLMNIGRTGRAYTVAEFLQSLGFALAIGIVFFQTLSGATSVGVLVALASSYRFMWGALDRFLYNYRNTLRELPYLALFKKFFDVPHEKDVGSHLPNKPIHVKFEDVWFRYPGSPTDILQGISFEFGEGDHIALSGLNGAGKSTLMKILMGIYQPTKGRILVNGVDLRNIKPSDWRRALAVMTQDQVRFDDTIHEQVLYGDYAVPLKGPHFETALDASGLGEVAREMPRNLETHAGRAYAIPEDDAIELSGGQVQIVAMARTLYRDARIYLFDEPTSSVDAEKEERFFAALPEALQAKAVIFVSHRLSVLRRAERILVIDQGKIIEDGSHDELIVMQGRYSELFTLQAKLYQ